jgi:hypothetical protein
MLKMKYEDILNITDKLPKITQHEIHQVDQGLTRFIGQYQSLMQNLEEI